jgi:hypothetical protein
MPSPHVPPRAEALITTAATRHNPALGFMTQYADIGITDTGGIDDSTSR